MYTDDSNLVTPGTFQTQIMVVESHLEHVNVFRVDRRLLLQLPGSSSIQRLALIDKATWQRPLALHQQQQQQQQQQPYT
jgi:hypothetical protein